MTTTEQTAETVEVDRLGGLLDRRPDLAHTPHLGAVLRASFLETA